MMKRMSVIEDLELPFIHSHEEVSQNCPRELVKANHMVIVLLFVGSDMAVPTQP
jgi:hypothetical protein